jgi:hypothetical protein
MFCSQPVSEDGGFKRPAATCSHAWLGFVFAERTHRSPQRERRREGTLELRIKESLMEHDRCFKRHLRMEWLLSYRLMIRRLNLPTMAREVSQDQPARTLLLYRSIDLIRLHGQMPYDVKTPAMTSSGCKFKSQHRFSSQGSCSSSPGTTRNFTKHFGLGLGNVCNHASYQTPLSRTTIVSHRAKRLPRVTLD